MRNFALKAAGAATVLGLAASTLGCVDNNTSIFIRQVQVPQADSMCIIQSDPSALMSTRGHVDVLQQRIVTGGGDPANGVALAYNVVLLVGNQLIRRGDADTLKVETSRVQLFKAEVEVFDFAGASLNSFEQPISGFVDAASGSEPGFGLTDLTLVDAATLASVGEQTLVARVQLFGESLGGIEVETGLWEYPIAVCNGCFGCTDPEDCEDEIKEVCNIGQDDAADCRCLNAGKCAGMGTACF